LARQVGCSAITLRKLEAEERRPSKQIAERLADVLRVPPDDRLAFLRFARGDPFAAPATLKSGRPAIRGRLFTALDERPALAHPHPFGALVR
jgi:transcriptional regulator with XRE-family HTH domain